MLNKSEILNRLNLGSSIAENDENLSRYFVPTAALNDFLNDRYDLIRGAKGSGKSAILKILTQTQYSQLADVQLVIATEHTGEPSFKRAFGLLNDAEVDESRLVDAWKAYLINLVLDCLERLPATSEGTEAIRLAENASVRYRNPSLFKKAWWSLLRYLNLKNFEVGWEKIRAEFPDAPPDFWTKRDEIIDFPEILRLCVAAFTRQKMRCWILADRLDAAFQDRPALEQKAIRSLILAYKDFMGHPAVRIKLFFRTDLFEIVSSGPGFRELTHVMDRTSRPITWNSDSLLQMIMERFAFNPEIAKSYGIVRETIQDPASRRDAFFRLFPDKIDTGSRKPDTWTWICSRVRDGNGVQTPRDVHALIVASADLQRNRLDLGQDVDAPELIGSRAIKAGLSVVSRDKIQTTLIAENPHLQAQIIAFEKQKAEQNEETLEKLLGADWKDHCDGLVKIGFLEKVGTSWKVPLLYRDGLGITQGAAFPKSASEGSEDD